MLADHGQQRLESEGCALHGRAHGERIARRLAVREGPVHGALRAPGQRRSAKHTLHRRQQLFSASAARLRSVCSAPNAGSGTSQMRAAQGSHRAVGAALLGPRARDVTSTVCACRPCLAIREVPRVTALCTNTHA